MTAIGAITLFDGNNFLIFVRRSWGCLGHEHGARSHHGRGSCRLELLRRASEAIQKNNFFYVTIIGRRPEAFGGARVLLKGGPLQGARTCQNIRKNLPDYKGGLIARLQLTASDRLHRLGRPRRPTSGPPARANERAAHLSPRLIIARFYPRLCKVSPVSVCLLGRWGRVSSFPAALGSSTV